MLNPGQGKRLTPYSCRCPPREWISAPGVRPGAVLSQSIPPTELLTRLVPKSLLCRDSAPLKVISPEGAHQKDVYESPDLSWANASSALCFHKCKMQMIPGQVLNPLSKPYDQMCSKIQKFLDFRKVIECLCTALMSVIKRIHMNSQTK